MAPGELGTCVDRSSQRTAALWSRDGVARGSQTLHLSALVSAFTERVSNFQNRPPTSSIITSTAQAFGTSVVQPLALLVRSSPTDHTICGGMVGGAMTWYSYPEGPRPCRWDVEESQALHMHPHSLTFFMNAVSQILGHRILEERSSFLTLESASPKLGTPNWEAIC